MAAGFVAHESAWIFNLGAGGCLLHASQAHGVWDLEPSLRPHSHFPVPVNQAVDSTACTDCNIWIPGNPYGRSPVRICWSQEFPKIQILSQPSSIQLGFMTDTVAGGSCRVCLVSRGTGLRHLVGTVDLSSERYRNWWGGFSLKRFKFSFSSCSSTGMESPITPHCTVSD